MLGVWQTGPAGRAVSRTHAEWYAGYRADLPDVGEADITGSPFAIRAYTVPVEFGGEAALDRLREQLHSRSMKLMLDFVPNHVALDHPWVEKHPEWFVAGTAEDLEREPKNWVRVGERILAYGRDPYFPGWPDTLQLNYNNAGLRDAMREQLVSLSQRCDAVRCDMAMLLLPDVFRATWGDRAPGEAFDFWPWAIASLRADFLLLAEVYWDLEWTLQQKGFRYTYDKRLYDRLRHGDANGVRVHLAGSLAYQLHCAHFLENHDEPRAAGTFAPDQHRAAAVLTYLSPGLGFFHEGQWEGRKVHTNVHLGRRVAEPIDQGLRVFYDRLLWCVNRPQPRRGQWSMCECVRAWEENPTAENYLAWLWQMAGEPPLLVAVNYGATQGQCYVRLEGMTTAGRMWELRDLLGEAFYERDGDDLAKGGLYLDMPAWGYHVFAMTAR
jgi:hypothetical protein